MWEEEGRLSAAEAALARERAEPEAQGARSPPLGVGLVPPEIRGNGPLAARGAALAGAALAGE